MVHTMFIEVTNMPDCYQEHTTVLTLFQMIPKCIKKREDTMQHAIERIPLEMPSIYAGHQIKGPSALLTMSRAEKRQPAMSCLTVAVINIINYKIHWIERSKESKYFHGVPCRW